LDILDIIRTRRSVRRFLDRPVPADFVEKILEAGRWAPSGLNNQPWRFAVVADSGIKEEISKLTRYSKIVLGANLLVPVFLDNAESYHRTKDAQAIGACLQNMQRLMPSVSVLSGWVKSSRATGRYGVSWAWEITWSSWPCWRWDILMKSRRTAAVKH
jgi:nitroreductase